MRREMHSVGDTVQIEVEATREMVRVEAEATRDQILHAVDQVGHLGFLCALVMTNDDHR